MDFPRGRPLIALWLLISLIFSLMAVSAEARAANCDKASLQPLVPTGTTITGATIETLAPPYQPLAWCSLTGSIATSSVGQSNQVLFAVGLPASWNQNFLFLGNEGFGGSIQALRSGEFADALSRGYAVTATDTGHESQKAVSALDGSFGLAGTQPNVVARVDFAWRAVHLSTVAGEALTEAFYDSPMFSFFDGCSTGGRQALVEAQQFPTDFNGIVAGDPAIGDPAAGFNWNERNLSQSPKSYLSTSKLKLLDNAVMQACDGADGVVDGLIQDPRKCNFNPSKLQCPYNRDSPNCLTNEQIAAVRAIYSGAASLNDGKQLYPGYTPSDPGGPDGWARWLTGASAPQPKAAEPWPPAGAPAQWSFQDQFMKYFVFDSAGYNALSFDPKDASQVAKLTAAAGMDGADAANPDLSQFFGAGGKLLMYHGWSDPAASPLATVKYYGDVAARLHLTVKALQNYARLFMVPGMHHCGGGPGPNVFDPLTPLVSWVEQGAAPDSLLAVHFDKNDPSSKKITRSMPLCAYPATATFTAGNVNDEGAWVCGPSKPASTSLDNYLRKAAYEQN
jgi:feruloyl esterase